MISALSIPNRIVSSHILNAEHSHRVPSSELRAELRKNGLKTSVRAPSRRRGKTPTAPRFVATTRSPAPSSQHPRILPFALMASGGSPTLARRFFG